MPFLWSTLKVRSSNLICFKDSIEAPTKDDISYVTYLIAFINIKNS